MKKYLITGGLGFIGSAFIRRILLNTDNLVLNLDKETYAANLIHNDIFKDSLNYEFIKGDICDEKLVSEIFNQYQPNFILNFAAESHVDNSINGPAEFINTNVMGTFNLLECFREYHADNPKKKTLRFLHISTDEVYGSLGKDGLFSESSKYDPSSPYSASKASSDHLINAWRRTYNLPLLITNCSNNYGPYQNKEKLIPQTILNAINNLEIPIYGDGSQIRDWLHVDDHTKALETVLKKAKIGSTYNIGSNNEQKNLTVVKMICSILDELTPSEHGSYERLITFVKDRPGHDTRYAIDASKIKNDLNWEANIDFENGLKETVNWYLEEYHKGE